MKTWSKIRLCLGIWGWVLATAWAAPATRPDEVAAAIQAIQQAADPSAVVTAYANGFAIDRNEPTLYDAYVVRMVDLGLPELAYHQAQTLTTLESNNGLAWGVVAYTDARRAQMPDALAEIILAGQFAPDNKFVQRTAGEIVAWYDLKADKTQLPANTKDGVARIRNLLDTEVAFSSAYDTAKKAYQGQASAAQPPAQAPGGGQVAPSLGSTVSPPPPYVYYPDYYAWGPGWVEPAPWWWWQPAGFFAGVNFFPFGTFFVFDDIHFFRHHHFVHHDRFLHHDRFFFDHRFHRDGFFVRDSAGRGTFFGTPARAKSSLAGLGRAGFRSAPPVASSRPGMQTLSAGRQGVSTSMMSPVVRSTMPRTVGQQRNFSAGGGAGVRQGTMGMTAHAPAVAAPPAQIRSSGGFVGGGSRGGGGFHSGGGSHGGGGFHSGGGSHGGGGHR